MKIIKTSSITIYMVNNKITCARSNKTGRFVKLAFAANELAKIQAKKIEKCSDVSSFTPLLYLAMGGIRYIRMYHVPRETINQF